MGGGEVEIGVAGGVRALFGVVACRVHGGPEPEGQFGEGFADDGEQDGRAAGEVRVDREGGYPGLPGHGAQGDGPFVAVVEQVGRGGQDVGPQVAALAPAVPRTEGAAGSGRVGGECHGVTFRGR
ncbi:hypothetical protein SSPS47_16755 [Streptomyces sp. S4.7]|nr:hypothetical protein SSPS47_16755 [Streptomyces sp. S4.7]